MTKDPLVMPINEVRRADRATTEDEEWIKALLNRAGFGALATVFDGQPFINSNLFVYDEADHAIYLHTAKFGRTRANIETYDRVCFSVSEMGRMLPAGEALEFSLEYSGVTVFGHGEVIDDMEASKVFLQKLLNKYAPHLKPNEDYRPPVEEEIRRTTVYKISIEAWSGKRKKVADDFPGAYLYEQMANGR